MSLRKCVYDTLEFNNKGGEVPRDLWLLPWAQDRYSKEIKAMENQYPLSFVGAPGIYKQKPIGSGNPFEIGEFTDDWGCKFHNILKGVHGEVKEGIVKDEDWEDYENAHIPVEWLSFDRDAVNRFCDNTDLFVLSAICPRPFEQMQFIRTTEMFLVDLMLKPDKMLKTLKAMHNFYCEALEEWAKTKVDGLRIMDDWGTQINLLISPGMWRETFKPLYKDYVDIAHRYGKKVFFHSDGNILDIYPDLIEIGVDALNSQIFCMGVENLEKYAGKITFWGEIDRQNLLTNASVGEVKAAVAEIKHRLWKNGGCIAQCEFGPGGKLENIQAVFEEWNNIG